MVVPPPVAATPDDPELATGATLTELPRVVADEPDDALDALEYVPLPPNARTVAAAFASHTNAPMANVIANVEMPNVFFINSLYLFNDITNVRIGSTAFYTKIHIATRPTVNYPV